MNKALSRFTHYVLRFLYVALSFNMSQDDSPACSFVHAKASDTSMPSENHDVQSSAHTATAMFHRLGLPVKPIDVCNQLVVLIGGFAQGYPTRNLGRTQIRL